MIRLKHFPWLQSENLINFIKWDFWRDGHEVTQCISLEGLLLLWCVCVCVWLHCDPWALPTPHIIAFCLFHWIGNRLVRLAIANQVYSRLAFQVYSFSKMGCKSCITTWLNWGLILFLLQYIGPLKCVNYEASPNSVHILSTKSIDFSVTHVAYLCPLSITSKISIYQIRHKSAIN